MLTKRHFWGVKHIIELAVNALVRSGLRLRRPQPCKYLFAPTAHLWGENLIGHPPTVIRGRKAREEGWGSWDVGKFKGRRKNDGDTRCLEKGKERGCSQRDGAGAPAPSLQVLEEIGSMPGRFNLSSR